MKKGLSFLIVFMMIGSFLGLGATAQELQVSTSNPSATVSYQVLEENLILVSAVDDQDNPVRGLTADDFTIRLGEKTAKIISAESLETNKKIGLNVVLVIDNSSSMVNRNAVEPLLTALDAFFKTVRPIDNVHMIVFGKSENDTIKIQNQNLNVKIHHSKDMAEMRKLAESSFKKGKGLSSRTVLYEAMFAGLDLVRTLPEKENKFLVVFSDGEDINSAFKSDVVEGYSKGIPNLEAYCVDFLETEAMDPFLKDFAENRGGRIWKAKEATELLPIFEAFSSKLLYRYVVSYIFADPPKGTITLEPEKLNFEMLAATNGSPIGNYVFFESGQSELPGRYAGNTAFDETKLKTPMEMHANVLNIVAKRLNDFPEAKAKIIGCNADTGLEKNNIALSGARADAVKTHLANTLGIDPARLKTEARNLPENPSSPNVPGGSAENRRVEIVIEPATVKAISPFMTETTGIGEMTIRSWIIAEYGVAKWDMDIQGGGQPLKTLDGADKLEAAYTVPLEELGADKLARLADLTARIRVTDKNGDAYETETKAVPISITKKELIHDLIQPPRGQATITPESLSFEMLAMTDGSPVSWYVFFEPGKSDISDTYVKGKAGFDEASLTTAMDKYKNVLNIAGKRLTDNPEGGITVHGCVSAKENNDPALAEKRANAVKEYLTTEWGIDSGRIKTKAVGTPKLASKEDVPGGSAENRRAEILFDSEKLKTEKPFVVETNNVSELKIEPVFIAGYNLAEWGIHMTAAGQTVKEIKGTGDMEPAYAVSVSEMGAGRIAESGKIETALKVTDIKGNVLDVQAAPVAVTVSKKELIHDIAQAPSGSLALAPENLTIEEITTIDSSPMLNYVFFESGESTLPGRYVLFANAAETAGFDQAKLKGTMEKYGSILNVLGKRLVDNPEAPVKIVGCNSNHGKDKGKKLSEARAITVKTYFANIWGIDPSRMTIEARNLPEAPSASRIDEGRAENQRVEIISEFPGILDNIMSTYVAETSSTNDIVISPKITSGYDIASWKIDLIGGDAPVWTKEGQGDPDAAYTIPLADIGLGKISALKELKAEITVTDQKGRAFKDAAVCGVKYIKREERLAMKMGYKVLEKYALILFDFDSDEIKARNKVVVDRIIDRMKLFPDADVKIVGHTDTIGKESYNLKLSERRAKAVHYNLVAAGIAAGEKLTFTGVGPYSPLYDNLLPEGRSLNRTVTVFLEYEGKE